MKVQQLTLPQSSIVPLSERGYASPEYNAVDFDTEDRDVKVIALIKGKEQYVFIYNESNRTEILRLLGRYASNPELSFTWYDAAVLSQRIRQESLQQTREKQNASLPRYSVPFPIDELF